MTKIGVARRQLGTTLAIYLDDLDPIAVHCLACRGGEVAEFLTLRVSKQPFLEHKCQCEDPK